MKEDKVAVVLMTGSNGSYKFDSVHCTLAAAELYVKEEFGNRVYNTRQEASNTKNLSFMNYDRCIRVINEPLR